MSEVEAAPYLGVGEPNCVGKNEVIYMRAWRRALPGLGNLTECVPLNRCGAVLDNSNAPNNQTVPCGFDEEAEILMICCPAELIEEPIVRVTHSTSV